MRAAILHSAAQLLERGEEVNTRAIAEETHVSIGTVYRYFNDREEIIGILLEDATQRIYGDLTAAVGAALDLEPDDATLLIVESLTASFERHAPILREIFGRGGDPALQERAERTLAALARVLPARHRPDLSPAELDDLVFVTMGFTANGCLRIALQRPPGADRQAMVEVTARMLSASLRP
ncbi:MAG: TetR family transcriptional regulator [Solirubrobacterales bacterium]